jgi:hypothetical protein
MTKEKKKYGWNDKFISSYYYEVETGRIVGQYSKISLSDEVYQAEVHGDNLGQYISEKCAKQAIEKQIEKNEQDNENAKKFVRF